MEVATAYDSYVDIWDRVPIFLNTRWVQSNSSTLVRHLIINYMYLVAQELYNDGRELQVWLDGLWRPDDHVRHQRQEDEEAHKVGPDVDRLIVEEKHTAICRTENLISKTCQDRNPN